MATPCSWWRDARAATVISGEGRPLVEDPSLRGGGLVLSAANLQTWLSESLGHPCRVTPRRLRYKPGTSAVLGFDLTLECDGIVTTEPCVASAYAERTAAKVVKTRRSLPPEACLAYDGQRLSLVTTAAGDRALPLLPRLGRPDGLSKMLARLLPDGAATATARTRTLRHNPGRRWVAALEREDRPTLLLRAYDGSASTTRAAACYRALEFSHTRTQSLVARSRGLAVMAVTWADGVDLTHTGDNLDLWRAAGSELARLHDCSGVALRHDVPGSAETAVRGAGRQIAALLPEIATEVLDLTRVTARELARLPRGSVAIHGDFSADQVVFGPDQLPFLIDLDAAHQGSPAYDIGCLVASTMSCAEEIGSASLGQQQVDAFLGGYEDLRRGPDAALVAVHTVAFRLRKAIDPFRACSPDWREQVTLRVDAARAALDDVRLSGGDRR